jgi:hypothetical protein
LKHCLHWTVFFFAKVLNRFSGICIPKEKAILLQILSGASGLLGSCASCLFRASFLQAAPFPTNYYHYGDTAWTYQNLPKALLAFHPDPVARFVVHDQNTHRTVDKRQIYRLSEELGNQLNPTLGNIVNKYIRSSIQIDKIRDPHPRFGWWWIPEAWQARWARDIAQRSLLQALRQF